MIPEFSAFFDDRLLLLCRLENLYILPWISRSRAPVSLTGALSSFINFKYWRLEPNRGIVRLGTCPGAEPHWGINGLGSSFWFVKFSKAFLDIKSL